MKPFYFVVALLCIAWSALCAPIEHSPGAMWAFEPARDEFKSDALLDLRYLNEKVAGESGYVTLSRDRNDFVLGNGKPARFWAVGTGYYKSNLDRYARFLAKRGVNMIRFHGNITPKENLMSVDTTERDKLWRTVAAKPKFELLAHNVIESDDSVFNGTPAVTQGRILLRSDQYLYCVGVKK